MKESAYICNSSLIVYYVVTLKFSERYIYYICKHMRKRNTIGQDKADRVWFINHANETQFIFDEVLNIITILCLTSMISLVFTCPRLIFNFCDLKVLTLQTSSMYWYIDIFTIMKCIYPAYFQRFLFRLKWSLDNWKVEIIYVRSYKSQEIINLIILFLFHWRK